MKNEKFGMSGLGPILDHRHGLGEYVLLKLFISFAIFFVVIVMC